jgi:hypothetical protein
VVLGAFEGRQALTGLERDDAWRSGFVRALTGLQRDALSRSGVVSG